MSFETWVSADGARVKAALDEALEWCEQFHVVADAPASEEGQAPFWHLVLAKGSYLGSVAVSRAAEAEHWLLETLQDAGCLRLFADGVNGGGNFVWCTRGVETRVLLASGAPESTSFEGPTLPWVFFGGVTAELPEGVAELIKQVRTHLQRPSDDELQALMSETKAPVYQREIRSVRDAVVAEALRGRHNFFELDEDTQVLALWSTLFGEGTLDLEQAIRLGAQRLRAQGWLEYQALRQAGEIYKTIEERLLSARRGNAPFDRPKPGHIRAIEPDADRFTAEDWRDCLMGALATQHRADRTHAIRLAFDYAQEQYGLGVQRLRGGGKAERAIKSAINSAIRQGYLERDGAMYLVRVAELGDPIQRGELEVSTSTAPPPVSEQAAAVAPPEPETSPEPEAAPAPELETAPTLLEQELEALEFPTRALNWAARKGIRTIGDLVAWDPAEFASERNVGRLTLRQTRAALEEALGTSWEEAWAAHHRHTLPGRGGAQPELDEEAVTEGGGAGWNTFAAELTDELRAVPLVELELPARMRNFAAQERIATVGELLSRTYDELIDQPNLGRKSLNDTLDAIQEYKAERLAPIEHASFLEAWRAQLANLKPLHRMIVSRRSGLHGAQETLEELGAMLGVSRERVRQIETRVVERMREKTRWRRMVLRHLEAAFGAGRAVPLDELAKEPWWTGMDREEPLLSFLIRRVLDGEYHLLTAATGRRYLVKFEPERFAQAQQNALERASRLDFPTDYAAVLAIVEDECSRCDPVLLEELEGPVREQLHFSEDESRVIGFGANRRGEVLAFLNAQPEPVPIGELEAQVGRGQLPDEVLYFKRGVVGLKKHFPDFDSWQAKLVPAAIEVMSARPVGRQWLVPEIHEELELARLLPDWLGHWHLASLLRLSGQVDYLGRLRVALKGSEQQERLHFEELLLELLEDAGEPLGFEELLRRARQRTDIHDQTAKLMVSQAPFVRLDRERVGLVERDIPGTPESLVAAVEAVTEQLSSTQQGLTAHQATELVRSLSELHAGWSRELVLSVLRSEATLRIDRSRNIGLDEWDDARCPNRTEFVRREVQRAGGKLSVTTLNERLAALYGRAPDPASLGQLADQAGLVRSEDHLLQQEAELDQAPASIGTTHLDGIPTELREMFGDLVKEPLSQPSELRQQVEAHVQAFLKEHQVNEFVDLAGAQRLAAQSRLLLEQWEHLPLGQRHLAHAAIRYFVIAENVEADFDIGGLDDDKRIMTAVLEHLGLNDGAPLAQAS